MKIVTNKMKKSMMRSIGIISLMIMLVFIVASIKGVLFHPVAIATAVCGIIAICIIYRTTYR